MLTTRKKLFISEYLIDENATQAAIRAGYSAKSAYAQGCRLLKDAEVARLVEEARDQRLKRTLITADYVLTSIKETVERCKTEGEEFQPFAVLKGLELLGKHLSLFTDKIQFEHLDSDIERELARLASAEEETISGTAEGDTQPERVN